MSSRELFCVSAVRAFQSLGLKGLCGDNGKENGNYYNGLFRVYIGIMEKKIYRDIGKENGNYCGVLLRAYIGMMGTKIYYNGLFGVI